METSKAIRKMFVLISVILIGAFAPTVQARSVYVIRQHPSSIVAAYDINDGAIEYQTTAQGLPNRGYGAVGLALDAGSETLFVTYEKYEDPVDKIELIDAKTMEVEEEPATAPGAENLAGVVFDSAKQKLYAVDRGTDKLFVYLWGAGSKTLTLEGDSYKILQELGPQRAYGMALDEANHLLYVTDVTSAVKYYDTEDPNFAYRGSIETSEEAVGIAIDSTRRYMYTGAFTGKVGQHNYVVRTDINDINDPSITKKDIGARAIGLTVDEATGFLYVTTSNDHIEVYNTNTWPSDPCHTETSDILDPADIIVAADVSFKWGYLGLEKVHDVNECVLPGEAITYTITYDACGWADSNVVLTDYLPVEVDFNSASAGYSYDLFEHTVTWNIGELDANESNSVTLNVIVNDWADMHRLITNCCEIEGDRYYAALICVDANVCCWPLDIIYVDQDAIGFNTGVSWLHAYTDLEHALNRARTCDANEIWVAAGTYHPTYPAGYDATFELVDGVPLYGGFAGYETTREHRNWLVNQTVLTGDKDDDPQGDVNYVVKAWDINEGTINGFVIEKSNFGGFGGAGIYCSNAGVSIEHNRIIRGGYGVQLYADSWGSVCYNEIRDNAKAGVLYSNADAVLLANNWIHHNDQAGVYIMNTPWGPLLRNNTIVDNGHYGVYNKYADVNNCIVWDNTSGSMDPSGYYEVTFSCVEGGGTSDGNINTDPCFVGDANDPNDYHLASDSPCIDAGSNGQIDEVNETDIDGEDRIIDGDDDDTATVDMGADEYYWSGADFNLDNFVNFIDYAIFAAAWQTSQGEQGYNALCNLANDNSTIDYNDLRVFCEDWLWYAAWTLEVPGGLRCGMDGGSGGGESMAAQSPAQRLEAEAYQAEVEEADIEELLDWLEDIWEDNEDLREAISEDEWEEFIEAVKSELD